MKKSLLILIISLTTMILCRIYSIGYYHISEWISFFFITPLIYSIATLFPFLKKNLSKKTILLITGGAIIAVCLSTDLAHSFWMQKIVMVVLGGLFTVFVNYKK